MKWNIRGSRSFKPLLEAKKAKFKKLGIGNVLADILANRNVSFEDIRNLLENPSELIGRPIDMAGCAKAGEAIADIIQYHRKVYVFADYDVDGLTAGYIMTKYLERQGYNVSVYYPQRSEGYGLSKAFIEKYCECGDVVITVDNGITAYDAVKISDDIGVTVLITDHHEPGQSLPKCKICDPQLGDIGHNLCGAAVALKVCQQLDIILGTNFWWQYVPYAALGTISDVMSMDTENMAIVRAGIKLMQKCAPNIWQMALALGNKQVTTEALAWKVIPRLNACGRLENIGLAKDFFFKEDQTTDIIIKIDDLNEQRKRITDKAIKDAMKKDYYSDTFCLFDATEYPTGIIGLIASRLSEEYQKPAIVYHRNNSGIWTGSVRSGTVDILSYLRRLQEQGVIYSCAGHSHACAVSLFPDTETFRNTLNGYLRTAVIEDIEKQIIIDSEISFKDLTQQLLSDIRMLPTDKDLWPEPIFKIKNLRVSSLRYSNNNRNNVCFSLVDENRTLLDIWGWNMAPVYDKLGKPDMIDIVGKVTNVGYGRNSESVTFTIEDIQRSNG